MLTSLATNLKIMRTMVVSVMKLLLSARMILQLITRCVSDDADYINSVVPICLSISYIFASRMDEFDVGTQNKSRRDPFYLLFQSTITHERNVTLPGDIFQELYARKRTYMCPLIRMWIIVQWHRLTGGLSFFLSRVNDSISSTCHLCLLLCVTNICAKLRGRWDCLHSRL